MEQTQNQPVPKPAVPGGGMTAQINGAKGGKKKLMLIIAAAAVAAVAAIFFFQDKIFPPLGTVGDTNPAPQNKIEINYSLEVKVDKSSYVQGENVKILLANKGKKPIWYLTVIPKCQKYAFVLTAKDDTIRYGEKYLWPGCIVFQKDMDQLQINKLDAGSTATLFEQKTFLEDGFYRAVFYYYKKEPSTDDIKTLVSDSAEAYSNKFEVKKNFTDNYTSQEVVKEKNDYIRKSNLNDLRSALESYSLAHGGKYPISNDITRLNDTNSYPYRELLGYVSMAQSFKDPLNPDYYYGYKSDGTSYELSAKLESFLDTECDKPTSALCIYKVSSGNSRLDLGSGEPESKDTK